MTLKEYIEEIIKYVEENIHEVITADIISKRIGFSKFYLYRIFQTYTGLTLMEYVRKRKLNHALNDLKTDQRILDIALNYGYGSERAFSRAFVNEFGKSPSHFRNNEHKIESKLSVYDLSLPRKDWIEMVKEYLSKVRYETLKEMTVISGIRIGAEPEEEIINLMMAFQKEHNFEVKRSFGFDSPVDEEVANKGHRGYEFWLSIDEKDTGVVEGTEFVIKQIPSYKYACLRITDPFENPMEKIPNAWKSLVSWIEENNVVCETGQDQNLDCLEEVIDIDGTTYMDILIPITKG
ncbi:MAG: helix-turn-helix domain-containing protein [Clostridiales bacterium]|nr:helix-turn-helix domain-containing protein [Clostridiales bacterium]